MADKTVLKALKITPRNYPVYVNLMNRVGQTPNPKAQMNGQFIVLRNVVADRMVATHMEIYSEVDFRTYFKWIGEPQEPMFVEVEETRADSDGEHTPWAPGGEDLGAV